VGGTKEKLNQASNVIVGRRHTIHQQSLQRDELNKVIKPSIIMQPPNSANQHTIKGTVLDIVNRVKGDPPRHGRYFFGHRGLTSGDELGSFIL
jgi:hypothetical protein